MKYLGYCKNKFVQKILILRTKNNKLLRCSQYFGIVNNKNKKTIILDILRLIIGCYY